MKRLLCLLTALFLVALPALSESITDMTGREVPLPTDISRIVVLSASDCEILYAIGAGDLVVGRGAYCDYPEAALALPAVESGAETNVEEILALAPDLVVMSMMSQTLETLHTLEAAGLCVIETNAASIEDIYAAVALLGNLTGHEKEAASLADEMRAGFAAITVAPGDAPQTVYFEVSPLAYGLWTAGAGTFMNEIAAMIGLQNIFADVEGWAQVSEEQVIARDPDYIVTIAMYFGEGQTPVEEILARPGWQEMKAVREERVYNADSNEISRPGPRVLQAATLLHDFVYK